MATVLSVGDVVKFDVTFVEQMFKKLAVRRTAGPSFCLLVRPATSAGAEQAVFVDLASGAVERAQRPAVPHHLAQGHGPGHGGIAESRNRGELGRSMVWPAAAAVLTRAYCTKK